MKKKAGHPLAARVKRLMQTDEDVGKIAQATPALIGRALEVFLKKLCEGSAVIAADKQAKMLTTAHLRAYVYSEPVMDFLKPRLAAAPDLAAEDEGDDGPPKPKRQRTAAGDALSPRGSSPLGQGRGRGGRGGALKAKPGGGEGGGEGPASPRGSARGRGGRGGCGGRGPPAGSPASCTRAGSAGPPGGVASSAPRSVCGAAPAPPPAPRPLTAAASPPAPGPPDPAGPRPPASVFAANSVAAPQPRERTASARGGRPLLAAPDRQLEAQCSRAEEGDRLSAAVAVASSSASAAPKNRGSRVTNTAPGLPSAELSIASSGEGPGAEGSGLSGPLAFPAPPAMLSVTGLCGAASGYVVPGASSALSAVLPRLGGGGGVAPEQDDYDALD